jgi:hypothetical protein
VRARIVRDRRSGGQEVITVSDENGKRPQVALVRDGAEQSDSDDGFVLVSDYIMGRLSVAERCVVERRLAEDPKFKEMAVPLMVGWDMPVPDEVSEGGSGGTRIDLPPHVAHPVGVRPAPWYEVLPMSWILRVGLTAAAALGAIGWLIVFFVRHQGQ